MSGICAVWKKEDPGKCLVTLAALSEGLRLDACERVENASDGAVGVGVSARFTTQQVYQSPEVLVACEADLRNEVELLALAGDTPCSTAANQTAATLAGLYQRFGTTLVEKLRGDFSVIIWDRQQKRLFAATDGFGIHPVVYYQNDRVVLVASRIDALLATSEVAKDINPQAIANYLNYTTNLAPATIFSRIKRLLPGTFLLADEKQLSTQTYWDMPYGNGEKDAGEDVLSRRLESLFEEAVQAHCKNDNFAKLGAFLSGGTDSSTVVGMMARLQLGPVKTFSIGFQEQHFNELEYARITARAFHADHHEYLVGPADCVEVLPKMIRQFDEPFGNSSAIPTYFCGRLAAQFGVDVLLAGDGGDELFGGNERYLTDRIYGAYQHVPRFLRKGLVEPVLGALPFANGLAGMARSYVRRSNLPQPDRFFSHHLLLANPQNAVFEDGFLEELRHHSVLDIPSRYYWHGPAHTALDRLLYVDVKMTLGDSDLPKVTRMAEMAGIRSRFPFLDRSVAEFSGLLPPHLKVKGRQKRYLFKRAFRQLLPREVIQKKKHGFGIPVALWLKSDKRMREITRDVLLSPRTYQRGYIRRSFIEDLFVKHETDHTIFYGDMLWTFLALELWFREFVDGPRSGGV